MLEELQIDEENHDLIKKVAELQQQLEQLNNYNKEFTAIKSIARLEIVTIFTNFLEELENTDDYNNIFDIDKILGYAYDIEFIMKKENERKEKEQKKNG